MALHKLLEVWNRPLEEKLHAGWSQKLTWIERANEPGLLRAQLDEGHSRFREGDLLVLHTGHPIDDMLARGLLLEAEDDDGWLLRGNFVDERWRGGSQPGPTLGGVLAIGRNYRIGDAGCRAVMVASPCLRERTQTAIEHLDS